MNSNMSFMTINLLLKKHIICKLVCNYQSSIIIQSLVNNEWNTFIEKFDIKIKHDKCLRYDKLAIRCDRHC